MVELPPHPLTYPGTGTRQEREYWRLVDRLVRERLEQLNAPVEYAWVYLCGECSRAFTPERAIKNDRSCPGCGLAVPRYRVEK